MAHRHTVRAFRILVPLVWLAACQPLPHPLADEPKGGDTTIMPLADAAGVLVGPVTGVAGPTAPALAEAMAAALREADVPADTTEANRGSFHLAGDAAGTVADPAGTAFKILWRLTAADGKPVAEDLQQGHVDTAQWTSGQGPVLTGLMKAEGAKLADLIQGPAPVERQPNQKVFVQPVTGAPGDGNKALPKALAFLLKRGGAQVEADARPGDIIVAGTVAVTPLPPTPPAKAPTQDHVAIAWRVLRPDGAQIGIIKQENDIPHGSLDGAWGDIAMAVASAAVTDVGKVVQAAGMPQELPKPAPGVSP